MKKYLVLPIILILSIVLAFNSTAEVTIKTSLDSTIVMMGKKVVLHIEILKEGNNYGVIYPELVKNENIPNTNDIEISEIIKPTPDSINLGNDRSRLMVDLIIQPFEPGLQTIPPFKYLMGRDTFISNELTIKVLSADVDTTQVPLTINDLASIESIPSKWYDFIPDFIFDYWYLILASLLIIIGIIIVIILWRKNGSILTYKKRRIPPYDLAMLKLKELKDEALCERGREREYYTRLPEIICEYLSGRFGINAIEMTSTQINSAIAQYKEPLPGSYIKDLLAISDFVKFAKFRPTPDENIKAYKDAFQFVEETKPVEIEAENTDSSSKNKKQRRNQKTIRREKK